MTRRSLIALAAASLVAGIALTTVGCGEQGNHTVTAPANNQAQIQQIQNDPHMPAQAKAAAIAALQRGQQTGAGGAQGKK